MSYGYNTFLEETGFFRKALLCLVIDTKKLKSMSILHKETNEDKKEFEEKVMDFMTLQYPMFPFWIQDLLTDFLL